MFNKNTLYLLGRLVKTHGIKGEYIMALNNIRSEDLPEIESVFMEIDGLLVPFFIAHFADAGEFSILIKFDDIDSKAKAKEYIGCNIYIPPDKVNLSDDLYSDSRDFIGYKIADKKYGIIGNITDILKITNNPLFKVKAENKEYLIPINENIIQKIKKNKKVIFINLPEGLLDI
jgi:16S rRNA processing protein RimM